MIFVLCMVFVLCGTRLGYADPELPVDVAAFRDRRDLCDHFRGEEPYDADRRKFIAESVRKYCTGTDRELTLLKAKYRENDAVRQILDRYQEAIEAGQ